MTDYLLTDEASERLLFRKVLPEDFEAWLPFHEEPLSSQYWSGLPDDPIIACEEQFARIFERYQDRSGGMNALVSKKTKKLIGLAGLLVQHIDGRRELEIGYSILPNIGEKVMLLKQHKNVSRSLLRIIGLKVLYPLFR